MAKSLIVSNFMPKWQRISMTKAIKLYIHPFKIYPLLLAVTITCILIANKQSFLLLLPMLLSVCQIQSTFYKAVNIKWVIICSSSSMSSGIVLSRPRILYVMMVLLMCAMASLFLFPVVKQLQVASVEYDMLPKAHCITYRFNKIVDSFIISSAASTLSFPYTFCAIVNDMIA